jgi:hypothetical protein
MVRLPTWPDPEGADCTFRVFLGKGLEQPGAFRPWGREQAEDRADVRAVEEGLSNVEAVMADTADVLVATGFPLLEECRSPERADTAFLTRESVEVGHRAPGIMMPGGPGSPAWTRAVRGMALRLGRDPDRDIAVAPVLAQRR